VDEVIHTFFCPILKVTQDDLLRNFFLSKVVFFHFSVSLILFSFLVVHAGGNFIKNLLGAIFDCVFMAQIYLIGVLSKLVPRCTSSEKFLRGYFIRIGRNEIIVDIGKLIELYPQVTKFKTLSL